MKDDQTTVAQLREVVDQFVAEREWQKYHTPKNLVMALNIEVAELMEHFQWRTAEECVAAAENEKLLQEIKHELADVTCYLLALSSTMGIDVAESVQQKMVLNRKKYPPEESKGDWAPPKPRID